MEEWFSAFFRVLIPLFVAIDPIGLAVVFLAMMRGIDPVRRRRVAAQATWTGGLVALLFLLLGRSLFTALRITVEDFQIAGGLILFILAVRDILRPAEEEEPAKLSEDFGVVPLGIPLIAGPALITTLLVLSQSAGMFVVLPAFLLNLVIVIGSFAYAHHVEKCIGATGMRAVSRIISLLLAAIAVNMVRHGWH